jgi:hypothetical protein
MLRNVLITLVLAIALAEVRFLCFGRARNSKSLLSPLAAMLRLDAVANKHLVVA